MWIFKIKNSHYYKIFIFVSLFHVQLPRSLLDRYHSSHSIPTFQLRFEARKTSIDPLSYKLEFSGVEDPTQAFIRIDIDPGIQSHSPPPEGQMLFCFLQLYACQHESEIYNTRNTHAHHALRQMYTMYM